MDTPSPPIMEAAELYDKAAQFAKDLVSRLEQINEQHPMPRLSEDEKKVISTRYGEKIPGPSPQDSQSSFERLFCSYIASRYIIVP